EDGIRDATVTGVQTCALPILLLSGFGGRGADARPSVDGRVDPKQFRLGGSMKRFLASLILAAVAALIWGPFAAAQSTGSIVGQEIGRASWREKVSIGWGMRTL